MKNYTYTYGILIAALIITLGTPAIAQSFSREVQQLSAINRINPLQNAEYDRADDVLSRKMIDRKNKVIGEVRDINVRANGAVDAVAVNFNRLRLGNTVFLNYRGTNIRNLPDAYGLDLDAEEVEEFYPQLLANIDTASGGDNDVYSVKKLKGISIKAEDGRTLGTVQDLLFGANGARLDALFVELKIGTSRGETIAIPFRSANMMTKNGRLYARIDNTLADAAIQIADD